MPRLLFVVNDASFFLSHRLPVARGARADGMEVEVATPPDPAVARIVAEGFAHHAYAASRSGTGLVENARTTLALAALYRRVRPDIVHHVTLKPVLCGSLAARLVGVRAVVNAPTGLGSVYVGDDRKLRAAVRTAYRLLLARRRSVVLFHNPDDRDELVRAGIVAAESARLVGGAGVDLTRFAPSPEPEAGLPLVVLTARLIAYKGVREFVAAARLLRGRGRFALVGEPDPGNPTAIPAAELSAWAAEGVVEVWGRRDDMPEVFRQAAIACLPSYREGLPKALLEAAACGRPIVATDVPGCREIVRAGDNGLLVPPRDAAALAAALGELLGDRARRARMGARGRELAQPFAEEAVVRSTVAIYRELLA